VATGKLGADLVLLNTAFSGPQLTELLDREHVDVLIYDQEYAEALRDLPEGPVHVIAWEDEPANGPTVDSLAIIERVPWRAEDTVVVAAPMFHAWGFGCLVLAATMANTVVMRPTSTPSRPSRWRRGTGPTGWPWCR